VMGGEVMVGLFGAMQQLLQPFLIASQSLVMGAFPSMVKSAALGPERQRKLTAGIIEMLLMVSIPFVIALAWIGDRLLEFVYHDPRFASAALPLTILAVGLLASSFNRALSFVLVANGHERVNLREVIISTVLGGTLSVVLIHQYGLIGAAITMPIVALIGFAQYGYAVHTRLFTLDYLRILARPLLVGVAMQVAFIGLTRSGQSLITILVVTALPCCAAVAWFVLRGGHRAALKPAVPLAGEG